MIVANRNPAGAPRPLPKPTAIGTLPVMAVIGAALATAMKMTATMPIEPFFRPACAFGWVSTASESVVIVAILVRIELRVGPATLQFLLAASHFHGNPTTRAAILTVNWQLARVA